MGQHYLNFDTDQSKIHGLIRDICERRRVSESDIKGKSQLLKLTLVRHEIFYQLAFNTGGSYAMIGRLFNRTEATVREGIKKHCHLNNLEWPRRRPRSKVDRNDSGAATQP